MKAIVYNRFGGPEVLRLEEIDAPVPADDEVLIRVVAASVNPYDWHFMRGSPYFIRFMAGSAKKRKRLGVDGAGRIEAVGKKVARFKPGDEVFGPLNGAFAEYATASESAVVPKGSMTFEQAAAVNIAGITALQALRRGQIHSGQRVLINGAGGGVGTFAVQLAKSYGAHVTGVCSTANVETVRSIGADRVIDYMREDFTVSGPYELILDTVGNRPLSAFKRALHRKGRYIVIGGWNLLKALFASRRFVAFGAKKSSDDLITIRGLIEAGKVTPVIGRRYPLSETPQAIGYVEEGHARGKVVINVE
jgi:NADPH:quinone reductase-like Zn-dependent oxidoreductase